MQSRVLHRLVALLAVFGLMIGSLGSVAVAQDATPVDATPITVATPEAGDSASGQVDLDVLFIGAHPDDEAGGLSTYGQWNEFNDIQVGVITITRGEGGGNAVGTEEGPALGILREAEERDAVGMAGIDHIYNLDKVDFYYTVSAPLTEETWGYDDTLERVVRVIRETKPEVIVTMNPSPTPGNHGHHQMAARLAIDAFAAAADPESFATQISDEGLELWRTSKILRSGGSGEGMPGPDCAGAYTPADPTDTVYGVWAGTISEANGGRTWGEIERDAQRMYLSQGWGTFPDADTDPALITCDYFTLIDSRVPLATDATGTTAILDNALFDGPTTLPLGSELYLTVDSFAVQAGVPFTVTAHVRVPEGSDVATSSIQLVAPEGWEVVGADAEEDPEATPIWNVAESGEITEEFEIVPAADAAVNTRYRIGASFGFGGGIGVTSEVVQVAPPVSGTLEPLPEIVQFREWAADVDVPQLDSLILPVFSIGTGETRTITVDLQNDSTEPQSGTVTIELPAGFDATTTEAPFTDLAPGASGAVEFEVTNSDTSLATSNQGGDEGTYAFTISTEAGGVVSTQEAGINLVPTTVVPQATTAPTIDGAIRADEYTGEPLDLNRVWEGDDPDSPADASGQAFLVWTEEGIYVAVSVTDETLGTVLTPEDAKRHWRTDSVEIAIDPLGTAPNTSSTFKVGAFPTTTSGEPAAYRDADAYQGPVATTAEGFEIASALTEPYTGYTLETFIPFSALPADIDPDAAAVNIFIYDSDTQDLTGQSRLGWSTWNGVQGDPYRWGQATFEGYAPPADARIEAGEPVMPLDVARSVDSPQSIAQAATDGVGLGGLPAVAAADALQADAAVAVEGGSASLSVEGGTSGTVNAFFVDDAGNVVANTTASVVSGGAQTLALDVGEATGGTMLLSFETDEGEVQAIAVPVDS